MIGRSHSTHEVWSLDKTFCVFKLPITGICIRLFIYTKPRNTLSRHDEIRRYRKLLKPSCCLLWTCTGSSAMGTTMLLIIDLGRQYVAEKLTNLFRHTLIACLLPVGLKNAVEKIKIIFLFSTSWWVVFSQLMGRTMSRYVLYLKRDCSTIQPHADGLRHFLWRRISKNEGRTFQDSVMAHDLFQSQSSDLSLTSTCHDSRFAVQEGSHHCRGP